MHHEFDRPAARRSRCTHAPIAPAFALRLLCTCLIALLAAPSSLIAGASAEGAGLPSKVTAATAGITPAEAQGLDLLLTVLPLRYASADPTHDPTLAAVSRLIANG